MQALELLEKIASQYGQSDSGRQAQSDLAELRADAAFFRGVGRYRDQSKAHTQLQLANAFFGAGRPQRAAEIYQQILDSYPKTSSAAEAREKLALADTSSP